jgi:hypothetical protein
MHASSAECDAHRKFTLARNRARQQQAGNIDARDRKHQAYGAEQQPERGSDVSDQLLPKTLFKRRTGLGHGRTLR